MEDSKRWEGKRWGSLSIEDRRDTWGHDQVRERGKELERSLGRGKGYRGLAGGCGHEKRQPSQSQFQLGVRKK